MRTSSLTVVKLAQSDVIKSNISNFPNSDTLDNLRTTHSKDKGQIIFKRVNANCEVLSEPSASFSMHSLQDALSKILHDKSSFRILRMEASSKKQDLYVVEFELLKCFVPDLLDLEGNIIRISDSELIRIQQVGLEKDTDYSLCAEVQPYPESQFQIDAFEVLESDMPSTEFKILHVFGYENHDSKQNLSALRTGELMYSHDSTVIVCNPYTKVQRIFDKHRSSITCHAVHPDGLTVATASSGSIASIFVWDCITLKLKRKILNEMLNRVTVVRMGFCTIWNALAIITEGALHHLVIVDWEKDQVLIDSPCKFDAHPLMEWNVHILDHSRQQIVTVNGADVFFWRIQRKSGFDASLAVPNLRTLGQNSKSLHHSESWSLVPATGDYVHVKNIQIQTCILCLDQNNVLTGSIDGSVYKWTNGILSNIFSAHLNAVRGLSINYDELSITTSGDDGSLKVWSMDFSKLSTLILNITIVHSSGKRCFLGFVAVRSTHTLYDLREFLQSKKELSNSKLPILKSKSFAFLINPVLMTEFACSKRVLVPTHKESEFSLCRIHPQVGVALSGVSADDDHFFVGQDFEDSWYVLKSVQSLRCSIAFATDHAVYFISGFGNEDCAEAKRLTEGNALDVFGALAVHPTLPIFVTATNSVLENAMQIWNITEKSKVCEYQLKSPATCMEFSSDANFLAVGTESGCTIYCPTHFKTLHEILYDRERISGTFCLKFSPCANYLALGSSQSTVDIFDVYGRHTYTAWISDTLGISLHPDTLEYDLADGVVLCYLIEALCLQYQDSLKEAKIRKLYQYGLRTDRPPLCSAWRNRPASRQECCSLLDDGLQLAVKLADVACRQFLSRHESFLMDAKSILLHKDDKAHAETVENVIENQRMTFHESDARLKKTIYIMLKEKLQTLRSQCPQVSELILESGALNKVSLFKTLKYLRAMDLCLNVQLESSIRSYREHSSRFFSLAKQEIALEKDEKSEEFLMEVRSKTASCQIKKSFQKPTSEAADMQVKSAGLTLTAIQKLKSDAASSCRALKEKIKVLLDDAFIMISSCVDENYLPEAITHMDWSLDSRRLRSCSPSNRKMIVWDPFAGQKLQELGSDYRIWATCNCFHGWTWDMSILEEEKTAYAPFFCESFLICDKITEPEFLCPPDILAMADQKGNIYISEDPPTIDEVAFCVMMGERFAEEVKHDRLTQQIYPSFVDPLCELLRTSRARFRIGRTSPRKINVKIVQAQKFDTDQRCAAQIFAELTRHASVENFSISSGQTWLKYVISIRGTLQQMPSAHSSAIKNIRSTMDGRFMVTIGSSQPVLSIVEIYRDCRYLLSKLNKRKSVLKSSLLATLQALKLGDGMIIISCLKELISYLSCNSFDDSGSVTSLNGQNHLEKIKEMSVAAIRKELRERNVAENGLLEKHELLKVLAASRLDPHTMKLREIKAELSMLGVSTKGLFEREDIVQLLKQTRANSHATISESGSHAHSLRLNVPSTLLPSCWKSTDEILSIFDWILSINQGTAHSLAITEEHGGICSILQKHRYSLVRTCTTAVRTKFKIGNSEASKRGSNDVPRESKDYQEALLKRGGELYELAFEASAGSIPNGSVFIIKDTTYKYVRYDEHFQFIDRLYELSGDTKFDPCSTIRIPYHKFVRWGLSLNVHVSERRLETPDVMNPSGGSIYSSALVFKLPCTVPQSVFSQKYSYKMLKDAFDDIDVDRHGYINKRTLKHALAQSEKLSEVS